jgi:serine/threonine-protein kinase RsbW
MQLPGLHSAGGRRSARPISERMMEYSAATIVDLRPICDDVKGTALALGCEPEAAAEMVVAVNEAVCNILTHGYHGGPGWLSVEVGRRGPDLEVTLRDRASPFDPTAMPPPDVARPLSERVPGGLGVEMIRSFTDEIRYRRKANGENVLVLLKRAVLPALPAA